MKSIILAGLTLLLMAVAPEVMAAQTLETPVVGGAVTGPDAADPTPAVARERVAPARLTSLQTIAVPDLLTDRAAYRLNPGPALDPASRADARMHFEARQSRRRGVTFLLVGGALLGAGLIIDGDAGAAVSVGGALVGAYGVFLLVRR
jgi:hypothetical protein